jgi:hypothetical protein
MKVTLAELRNALCRLDIAISVDKLTVSHQSLCVTASRTLVTETHTMASSSAHDAKVIPKRLCKRTGNAGYRMPGKSR